MYQDILKNLSQMLVGRQTLALFYLLTAPFCTGVILDVDGGHGIRQYANPSTDPMRLNNNAMND
jgi:multisubunit Na+/H+ antiporter MnhG subunit